MEKGSSIAMVQLETTGHFSSEIQNMSKTVSWDSIFNVRDQSANWSLPVSPVPAVASLLHFPAHINSKGHGPSQYVQKMEKKMENNWHISPWEYSDVGDKTTKCAETVSIFTAQEKHLKPSLFHKGLPESELRSEAMQFVRQGEILTFRLLRCLKMLPEFGIFAPFHICNQICICRILSLWILRTNCTAVQRLDENKNVHYSVQYNFLFHHTVEQHDPWYQTHAHIG